jgi:predicted RNase H-like HicB family nuclease
MRYTLVITSGKDGYYIGQLKELPAVFTQGHSIEEIKENIGDVLKCIWKTSEKVTIRKAK